MGRAARTAGLALAALTALAPPAATAATLDAAETMALCETAAIAAADRHGVPREVLVAITLVETRTRRDGRSGAWPWTVNVAGKGDWFDSRAAALLHAQAALEGGETSFDVGCFQINYRWHGKHFASIDAMFEPGPAGDYAARFLKELYAETGDWIEASGLYHSRTEIYADRYKRLVAKAVAAMGGDLADVRVAAAAAAAAEPREEGATPRIFRVTPAGGMAPARRYDDTVRATAGGVGLIILRRGQGGLLRLGRAGLGG